MKPPIVLTIAGHDPSGGAGVTADLRVIEAFGCAGISVITALTVQNTLGVESVHPTDSGVLRAQLRNLLTDIRPDAVKIGMLAGAGQVHAVAEAIREFSLRNVVLDTVFASTGGVPLLDESGIEAMVRELFPLCDLITPNLDEAERLTGLTVRRVEQMEAAGRRLIEMGAKHVLVKGGHLVGDPTDVLFADYDVPIVVSDTRIGQSDIHGTGCFISSSIAASLTRGQWLTGCYYHARYRLGLGIGIRGVGCRLGRGVGYPVSFAEKRTGFKSLFERRRMLTGVYLVATPRERSVAACTSAALAGGARVVQARMKDSGARQNLVLCRQLAPLCRRHEALFIINDDVAAAASSGADGVHLGPDDMSPRDARRLLDRGQLIGVSVNTVEEAAAAAPYASYFGVGPVFGTSSKHDAGEAIGVGRLREIKAAFPHIPIVAIGGINKSNIALVRDIGVEAAAVISAVTDADDMEAATRELVEIWKWGIGGGEGNADTGGQNGRS